jgi:hypothetical protein
MEVLFYPQDEEQFKKEAVGNFVHTEVTCLSTNEILFTFRRKVTKYWDTPCKNNIVSDHRIKALEGSTYRIENWIESSEDMVVTKKDNEKHYWIASSKPTVYDSIKGFKEHSEIDWGNAGHNKINVGDIVYIYITQPEQKIAIKTEVIKSGYGVDKLLDGDGQFNRDEEYDTCDDFIRLKLVHFIDSAFLGIDDLHKHGIDGNIQGKRKVSDQTLLYIQYHERNKDLGIVSIEELTKDLEKAILFSKYSTPRDREERLEQANKKPTQIEIRARGFKRNADVIVTVLDRANGVCERCNQEAPFIRKKDNTPYLEVHHKKQLSEGGEDSVENAIAICPNCHRELHFGVSDN